MLWRSRNTCMRAWMAFWFEPPCLTPSLVPNTVIGLSWTSNCGIWLTALRDGTNPETFIRRWIRANRRNRYSAIIFGERNIFMWLTRLMEFLSNRSSLPVIISVLWLGSVYWWSTSNITAEFFRYNKTNVYLLSRCKVILWASPCTVFPFDLNSRTFV